MQTNTHPSLEDLWTVTHRTRYEVSVTHANDARAAALCLVRAYVWAQADHARNGTRDPHLWAIAEYWSAVVDAVLVLTPPGTYLSIRNQVMRETRA